MFRDGQQTPPDIRRNNELGSLATELRNRAIVRFGGDNTMLDVLKDSFSNRIERDKTGAVIALPVESHFTLLGSLGNATRILYNPLLGLGENLTDTDWKNAGISKPIASLETDAEFMGRLRLGACESLAADILSDTSPDGIAVSTGITFEQIIAKRLAPVEAYAGDMNFAVEFAHTIVTDPRLLDESYVRTIDAYIRRESADLSVAENIIGRITTENTLRQMQALSAIGFKTTDIVKKEQLREQVATLKRGYSPHEGDLEKDQLGGLRRVDNFLLGKQPPDRLEKFNMS